MFDVPADVIERFKARGAVRCSVAAYKRHPADEPKPFLALVYFWDAQGREIGYWNRPCGVDQVFAPDHREWGAESLAHQLYEDLDVQVRV